MKKYFAIGVLSLMTVLPVATNSQTSGTELALRARFDDGTLAEGTVTLGQVHVLAADTILARKTLLNGYASVTESLSSNTLYNITLTSRSGYQLVKFPITTALINPENSKQAEIHIVLHKADNSLKSAYITISMGF
jgi:hypothetical protein